MPARRKIHLPLTEMENEDIGFECPESGPILSGDGTADEDLVCGRCERTLFLALTRDDLYEALVKGFALTKTRGRRFPLVAICDCGAINRVWPLIPG